MIRFFLIITVLLISLNIYCQNKGQVEVKVTLRDGSIYNGTTIISNIELNTKYGKLVIPIADISYIEVGITADKANESKIIDLLSKLSNESVDIRKTAYEELLSKSVNTVPIVYNYIYSDKYQQSTFTDYNCELLFDELTGKYSLSSNFNIEDILSVDYKYLVGGEYNFKLIDLKTEFGQLSIPKEKIQKIDIMYIPGNNNSSRKFVLNASKHISGNTNGGWLKTGIMVKKGQNINILANGEVVLQSLSGAKYNPDGAVTKSTYEYDDYAYSTNTYPQYGNVVYKIGENGTMIKAGSKYNGIANENGMLYISIYETVYNASNTGSYNLSITLK